MFQLFQTWFKRKQHLRQLHSKDFDVVSLAIYQILNDSKFYTGPRTNMQPSTDGVFRWTMSRERVYTVMNTLAYLEKKKLRYPFYDDTDQSLVTGTVTAIANFPNFEIISSAVLYEIYQKSQFGKNGKFVNWMKFPDGQVYL